jgi:hypothetical protein
LGAHSYDPGVSPTLGLWTIEIPDGSVEVDLHEGEAVLHLENVCRIFDAFSVPNSLNPLHPLGLVSAFLKSLRIEWKGITTKRSFNNGSTFRGDFVENSAAIAVTVSTPDTKPPFTPTAQNGFQFVANPASTVSNFAQIGHENNGALF